MQKVVVTGGAGFIGSHLAEELSSRDYHVTILDNLTSGRMENVQSFIGKTNVEFVEGSITDIDMLKELLKGVSTVFHQAAIPGVPQSVKDPLLSNEVNATGTLNVLLAARDSKVNKVIYASSSSVYGDTPTLPKHEDMMPYPQSPYAISKLAGEYYCQVFTRIYNLPTVCLRYFNVYGLRQNPHSEYAAVIPAFINTILSGKSPVIYGDGKQTRDFTFVKDVVSANIMASTSDSTGVFNIAGGRRVSITNLARRIIKLTCAENIELTFEDKRAGDIKHSLAEISKAEAFGYTPNTVLDDGLGQIIRELCK